MTKFLFHRCFVKLLNWPAAAAAGDALRRRSAYGLLRDEAGIVVLGPLIVVTVLVLFFGGLGYLKNRKVDRHQVSTAGRELRHAAASVPVRYGGIEVERIAPGTTVWVYPLDGGQVAVFRGERAPNVVGFAPDSLLRPAAAPSS